MDEIFTDKKSDHTQAVEVEREPREAEQSPSSFNSDAQLELLNKKFLAKALAQQYQVVKTDLKRKKNPRSLYEMGNIYFAKKVFTTAKGYYLKTVEQDSNFILAYHKLFIISLIENKLKEADNFYSKIVALTNRDPVILHNYALFKVVHFKDDKNIRDSALEDIKEIMQKKPSYYEAVNSYGFVLLNFYNDVSGAEKYFDKSLKINPKFAYALNNLGVCKLRLKNYDEAESLFYEAFKNSPNYPAPYENLASSFIQQKKFDKALNILQTAIDKHVTIGNQWVHAIGFLHIELKSFEKAIDWYKHLLSLEPRNDFVFNNLGHCQRVVGKLSESETCFRTAVEIAKKKIKKKGFIDNRSFLAFYNLGRVLIDKGQEKELTEISKEILRMNPKDAFGTYLLGASYMRKGEFEEAAQTFDKSLSLNPMIIEVYPDFSFIILSLFRDYKSAIKLLESALKLNLITPLILNNLAVAYIKNGQNKKAAEILKKITSPDPTLIATKGLLAFRQDDLEKGNEFYRSCIEKIKPSWKNVATQIWLYEQSLYWFKHNNLEYSKNLLSKSKKIGKSYVWFDIQDLEKEMDKTK